MADSNGMTLTSTAFDHEAAIPQRFSCDGDDVSPALSWAGVPEGTESFAFIVDDPDAPGGTFVHWVYFNIPSDTTELPEGVPTVDRPSQGGVQGQNNFRRTGYGGPCPPGGTHRYFFNLYALDTTVDLEPGAGKVDLMAAMDGHVLAQAQLMGTYTR